MLTLQQIIDEADAMVPNEFDLATKVSWLNNINQDFFNVVKIPAVTTFTTSTASTYTLPNDVRMKNVDKVIVGSMQYRSFPEDDVQPLQNYWTFNDSTHVLTLSPAPYKTNLSGIVRYHRIATTTFLSSNMSAIPDAPEEYHWTFIPALCEQICLAMDDPKMANFNQQYTSAWNVAALNYQAGGTP